MSRIYIDWRELINNYKEWRNSDLSDIRKTCKENYIIGENIIKDNMPPLHYNKFNQSKKDKLLNNLNKEITEYLIHIGMDLKRESMFNNYSGQTISTEEICLENEELNFPY